MRKIVKLIVPFLLLPAYLYYSLYYVRPWPAHSYADTDGNWAAIQIVKWCDRGLLSLGKWDLFHPDDAMRLADVCVILTQILPLEEQAENRYPEIGDGQWFAESLLKCVAAGIVVPRGEGVIQPYRPVLRGEVYPMVARAFGLTPAHDKGLSAYYGGETLPEEIRPYYEALAEHNLIGGEHPMYLRLDGPFTRAEMADLLTRLQLAGLIE